MMLNNNYKAMSPIEENFLIAKVVIRKWLDGFIGKSYDEVIEILKGVSIEESSFEWENKQERCLDCDFAGDTLTLYFVGGEVAKSHFTTLSDLELDV